MNRRSSLVRRTRRTASSGEQGRHKYCDQCLSVSLSVSKRHHQHVLYCTPHGLGGPPQVLRSVSVCLSVCQQASSPTRALLYTPRPGRAATSIAISVFVCLSAYFKTTCPDFTKLSVHDVRDTVGSAVGRASGL